MGWVLLLMKVFMHLTAGFGILLIGWLHARHACCRRSQAR